MHKTVPYVPLFYGILVLMRDIPGGEEVLQKGICGYWGLREDQGGNR